MSVAMIGPKFYAFDRDGKPLAFGKLYAYKARTNVPQDTYQTEDQLVANTNPVILNGEGYANVYLSGSYKMVLKDKDENEIWSADPVTSVSSAEWENCMAGDYLAVNSFSLTGNFTSVFDVGRSVRFDTGTVYSYATIKTSIYSGGNTVITVEYGTVPTGIETVCSSIIGINSTGFVEDIRANTEKNTEQDAEILELQEINSERDAEILALEEKNTEQDTEIAFNKSANEDQDSTISLIEDKNTEQDNRLTAVENGQSSGVIGYATQDLLFADLNPSDNSVAYVTNDTLAINNGTYTKSGSSGSGSWVQASSDLASQAYQKAEQAIRDVSDQELNCNTKVGGWVNGSLNQSTIIFDVDHVSVTTITSTYPGMRASGLKEDTTYKVKFDVKLDSGNAVEWAVTNGNIGDSTFEPTSSYTSIETEITTDSGGAILLYQKTDEDNNTLLFKNMFIKEATEYQSIQDTKVDSLLGQNIGKIDGNQGNKSFGDWITNKPLGVVSFDVDHIKFTPGSEIYSGVKLVNALPQEETYTVVFDAKLDAGNVASWYTTNGNVAVGGEIIQGLTTEWKSFVKEITGVSGGQNILFYQDGSTATAAINLKNIRWFEKNSWESNVEEDLALINDSSLAGSLENNDYGSVEVFEIDTAIGDITRPDTYAKMELKTENLMPSINNVGNSYLFDNGGTIELRVVKDATEIVGVELTSKVVNTITPVSFSVVYVGDSITAGVGAPWKYAEQTSTLLKSDGHVISKDTVQGHSGKDALQLNVIIAGETADAHDYAVLMVGTNDIEHWVVDNGYPDDDGSIHATEFRAWYRENLTELVATIKSYCSCSMLFISVPVPQRLGAGLSVDRTNANPLAKVVAQEVVRLQESDSTLHLVRQDYYLRDPTAAEIPDNIHPSDEGAGKMAKGLRDEMTFRV